MRISFAANGVTGAMCAAQAGGFAGAALAKRGAAPSRPLSRPLSVALACGVAVLAVAGFGTSVTAQAAELASRPDAQVLRGTVLPLKKSLDALASNSAWVASLNRTEKKPDILARLDFSNFRFGFKPPPVKRTERKIRLRYASLGPIRLPKTRNARPAGRAGNRLIKWLAYPGCVPRPLKTILDRLAKNYGHVTVNSTHRSVRHNREVGGAKHSYHLKCQAVDFRISGNYRSTIAYLKKQPQIGGLKHYGGGRFHIDIGPRRTW